MFTKEQIITASAKVKTGADYPQLVQDLKDLGVLKYDHFVADGSNVYCDKYDNTVKIEHGGQLLIVSNNSSADKLKDALRIHQAGQTDYPTFCAQAAEAGVEKWVSDLSKMTVAYLDRNGETLLVESIPATS